MDLLNRPLGIMILAAITVAGGLAYLFAGLGTALTAVALFTSPTIFLDLTSGFGGQDGSLSFPMIGSFLAILGAMLVPMGIAFMAVAIGLFRGKGWSWTANVILSIIGIAYSAVSMVMDVRMDDMTTNVIGLGIAGGILVYMFKPDIREFFGKLDILSHTKEGSAEPSSEAVTDTTTEAAAETSTSASA